MEWFLHGCVESYCQHNAYDVCSHPWSDIVILPDGTHQQQHYEQSVDDFGDFDPAILVVIFAVVAT